MNVVILAAGPGTRMHSSTPKVLHRLAGRAMLTYVFDTAKQLSPEVICVVYGHGGERVRQAVDENDVVWVMQEPQLGTGHAVMQAAPHLDERWPTLVLYGDVPLIRAETLKRLVQATGKGLGLLTATLDGPSGYGRILRNGKKVVGIVEEKDANSRQRALREINTGIVVAPTKKLKSWLAKLQNNNAQKEYYLTDIVALATKERVPVTAIQADTAWEALGVNSRAQLAELERVYQRKLAASLLEQGVALADPSRCDVRGSLACGRDVAIDVNCVFEGEVKLGDGVSVGANCVLKDVTVGPGTRVEPFCHLENADIGADCRIGPYARIRPGTRTRLADGVHIGNFVEVKASSIGAGSKANHLSYIGDSEVGRNVNVGAGTIVCNYDGANKHRTVIEDDVFIGSGTQLVAPVRVGRGATLGAGTTLTKDAPAGELTLSRVKQVSIPDWERPVKKK
ncbi:MAG: UDP-N-acetylglucosamine diphosphorylase/glucosamine-1-phosphate N-acetyltransferase [Betaproteobacteria bacterium]|nr:MAG: UDP-N-acetylglucosamine diphosphorylase/glucosamine-1-phosphate N-acetyltransferase [Betaproteobacteria bacterium]TMH93733.1 MAG: UDP-N-acetylglucosamine diphosphorylase/glucosamine-1-phosphate N-acetyltransferase [Betaproteobacteria bacterium]